MFKMRNKGIIWVFIFSVLMLTIVNVSAVCCEKLKDDGMWCIAAAATSECDSGYRTWFKDTCSSVSECKGTCINLDTGKCSEYTPKTQCIESGGSWSQNSIDQVPACQQGCCVIGLDAYFVTNKECLNMFTEYNIQGTFKSEINSRDQCELLSLTMETGACVVSTSTEKSCKITSNTECTSEKIGELSQYLKNPTEQNQIEVRFYKDLLCTASVNGIGLSDCVKTQNTVCSENKVYYTDSCGNLANIYDSTKYNNVAYWTNLKKEYDEDICKVGASGSSTCGNCDTTLNTVCRDYTQVSGALKPQNNADGLICGDLSCQYKGRTYQHGESWCAESPGVMIINKNLTTGELIKSNLTALKNATKYNLPGSRYYKMVCSAGEVLVEECADYRNSVCIQGVDDYSKRIQASCVFNPWRACSGMETKTSCENPNSLCKWIPGYRWNYNEFVPEANRKEMQGSCVPLIAPGFDFWNGTSSKGMGVCAMAGVVEYALYETTIWENRSNMVQWSKDALSARCVDGCYAIPFYGKEFVFNGTKIYPEDVVCLSGRGYGTATCPNNYSVLTEFYDESEFKLPEDVKDYYLSTRRGQYCYKSTKQEDFATGKVTGQNYDCTPGLGGEEKEEKKERDYPVYLTNQEFIMSITERTDSLGDCGYKVAANGKQGNPEAEIITSIFQKMSQKGNVKENVTVEQIIFKGNSYLKGDLQKYETALPSTSSGTANCATTYNGICTSNANNPEPCIGGTANAEGVCPANMICCVYPE